MNYEIEYTITKNPNPGTVNPSKLFQPYSPWRGIRFITIISISLDNNQRKQGQRGVQKQIN